MSRVWALAAAAVWVGAGIVPTRLVALDHNEYLAFLGALGLLVQLTLTKTSTDSSD